MVTVARFSWVISSATGWLGRSAKRTSRLVRMPTSLPPRSTTGMPLIRCRVISACACASVASGVMVIGLTTMPLSNRFTARTASHCSCTVRLRCRTPIPPNCAITIAMSASVTVSIADDSTGMLSAMPRVNWVAVSAMLGRTSDAPGTSRTSSKVRPSRMSIAVPVPARVEVAGHVTKAGGHG